MWPVMCIETATAFNMHCALGSYPVHPVCANCFFATRLCKYRRPVFELIKEYEAVQQISNRITCILSSSAGKLMMRECPYSTKTRKVLGNPSPSALEISLGPRDSQEISRVSGMDFPIPPSSWRSTDTMLTASCVVSPAAVSTSNRKRASLLLAGQVPRLVSLQVALCDAHCACSVCCGSCGCCACCVPDQCSSVQVKGAVCSGDLPLRQLSCIQARSQEAAAADSTCCTELIILTQYIMTLGNCLCQYRLKCLKAISGWVWMNGWIDGYGNLCKHLF